MHIALSFFFILEETYAFIRQLENHLERRVLKILPSEYAISRLKYPKPNVVIIDIGSLQTSVIIKVHHIPIAMKKLKVGMDDLIKEISKVYKKPKIEIIRTIDSEMYIREKTVFLELFKDIICMSLSEMLK